jgi:hypothetical protein
LAALDALRVTVEFARILERLRVPYFVGGSLASSLQGIPRATLDADLVADLRLAHVLPLTEALQASFYVDDDSVRQAVVRRSSFNAIHRETAFKVDVFVLRDERYARFSMARRQRVEIDPAGEVVLEVATPEDVVLEKLRWYRLGNEVSERQWNDVQGVLKVQAGNLDLDYLRHWAPELGVEDLLEAALSATPG